MIRDGEIIGASAPAATITHMRSLSKGSRRPCSGGGGGSSSSSSSSDSTYPFLLKRVSDEAP